MIDQEVFLGPRPALRGERIALRPFEPTDAPRVRELAGAREIAEMTLTVPHPYGPGVAETWIDGHEEAWRRGERLPLAIVEPEVGVVGAVGLQLRLDHRRAELGYWVGVPFWNRGYASDASRTLIDYGFRVLDLHRIVAHHFARNPASGRVLVAAGMSHEGYLRQHIFKDGRFEDLVCYGILRDEQHVFLVNPGRDR